FSSLSGILGDCPVRPPQWGTVRERVLQDGTLQIVYSCEPGRKLKGHKIATCTADGWDEPVPKCVPPDFGIIFSDWNQSKLTICAYQVSHDVPAMSIAMRHYTNLIDVSQLST
ncbi:hypothetical protein ALC56_09978, partial [Trachymyrmex septentrionalis]